MPINGFEWVEDISKEFIKSSNEESNDGYFS